MKKLHMTLLLIVSVITATADYYHGAGGYELDFHEDSNARGGYEHDNHGYGYKSHKVMYKDMNKYFWIKGVFHRNAP